MNTDEFRNMARKWVDDNLPEDVIDKDITSIKLALLLLDAYGAGLQRAHEIIINAKS